MKTILITISRGFLARNILQTDIFSILKRSGHRLVIATPAWQDREFIKEFQGAQVEFVPMETPEWNWLDKIFMGLNHNLVWNRTILFTVKYGIYDPDKVSPFRLWIQLLFWRPLSHLVFLRKLSRYFDKKLCPPSDFVRQQIKTYNPDLLFSTNPMEHWDSYYIKAAEEAGIPTVGLVKSWDNMSKTSFRILTDEVIVWGPYMEEEAKRYQLYPAERIHVLGVPQFDIYTERYIRAPREKTLADAGLDPERKTILFGSEGKVTPDDPEIVGGIMQMIDQQDLIEPCQVWVRPHFGYKKDEDKFLAYFDRAHAYVDRKNVPRMAFYDQWDYSREHYFRLADTLQVVDILVTTASTLAIDAAACSIPTVLIAFDGSRKLPHRHSVARWYETEYYSNVIETGAAVKVYNFSELQAALNALLADTTIRSKQRRDLVTHFAGAVDGHSSERIASFLLTMLETDESTPHV